MTRDFWSKLSYLRERKKVPQIVLSPCYGEHGDNPMKAIYGVEIVLDDCRAQLGFIPFDVALGFFLDKVTIIISRSHGSCVHCINLQTKKYNLTEQKFEYFWEGNFINKEKIAIYKLRKAIRKLRDAQ